MSFFLKNKNKAIFVNMLRKIKLNASIFYFFHSGLTQLEQCSLITVTTVAAQYNHSPICWPQSSSTGGLGLRAFVKGTSEVVMRDG